MPTRIGIAADIRPLLARLSDAQRTQIPFATSVALNRLMRAAKDELRAQMQRDFDRPTPYTLNSLRTVPATRARLEATVDFKDAYDKGTPAEKYLGPEVLGGSRGLKRFERALQRIGVLPLGMQVVPGDAAPLDQYGNVSKGLLVRVLAYFQAFGEQGYTANTTAAKRKRMTRATRKNPGGVAYFALQRPRNGLRAGIYQRFSFAAGSAVKPLLMFVRAARYEPRLRLYETAQAVVRRDGRAEFERALAQALVPRQRGARWG